MKRISWNPSLPWPEHITAHAAHTLRTEVAAIIDAVRSRGDQALAELSARFEPTPPETLRLNSGTLEERAAQLNPTHQNDILRAIQRVRAFHAAQMPQGPDIHTNHNLRTSLVYRPITPVGLYVPGGRTPLFSTLIMLAVPAQTAGCQNLIVCTPPDARGCCHPAIAFVAHTLGIPQVFLVGGAQAIAAMGLGTQTIPKVRKIFGPGSARVVEAKNQISRVPQGPAIDFEAGPSEILVVADHHAPPDFIACELLAQAEHGPDSRIALVSPSANTLKASEAACQQQLADMPGQTCAHAFRQGIAVHVPTIDDAVAFANHYAPEHLALMVENPRDQLDRITSAGAVMIGPWTPTAASDYNAGVNHTLPTMGTAARHGGLTLGDFLKPMSVVELNLDGLAHIGHEIIRLAQLEGLEAHARSVSRRLDAVGATP